LINVNGSTAGNGSGNDTTFAEALGIVAQVTRKGALSHPDNGLNPTGAKLSCPPISAMNTGISTHRVLGLQ
jgi:hypothetical protein